ncbi:hypothetical protein AAFP30_26070 [Gordonia sp. CPCC 205515]|uniref:hypothetical protein n=1 Tax=Gordonia sp. CPCC 205515 TaxID=3140791 RepID=UPI003AF3D8C1
MNDTALATALITEIAYASQTAPARASELVHLAHFAQLPTPAISAAIDGHRTHALDELRMDAYRVIAVEDSKSTRYYEVRATDDHRRIVGFYDADIARDAARVLNSGIPEVAVSVGDTLR